MYILRRFTLCKKGRRTDDWETRSDNTVDRQSKQPHSTMSADSLEKHDALEPKQRTIIITMRLGVIRDLAQDVLVWLHVCNCIVTTLIRCGRERETQNFGEE